jgi:hypothetical protein
VLIHTGSEATGDSSYQIDMDPASSGFDALLDAGQWFYDSAIGLTIMTVQSGPSGASVDISFGGAPPSGGGSGSPATCTAANPEFTATPTSTVQTNPSVPVSYTVSVKNMDTDACAASQFALAAGVPSGWSVNYGAPSVLVAPGATATTTIALTPGNSTGTFGVTLGTSRIVDKGGSGSGASVSRSISVVSGSGPSGPPAPTSISVSLSVGSSNPYTFTATVSSSGTAVAGASVSFAVRNPTGLATTLSSTTDSQGVASAKLRLKPKDPKGTYLVTATATSGGVTGTATGSFVY